MHYTHERRLISNLDPFHLLMHFFKKYSKIYPNIEDLIAVLGDEQSEVKEGLIYVRPFDKKIRNVRIQADVHDPSKPHSLQLRFSKTALSFQQCIRQYGAYQLQFNADDMISLFSFQQLRSIYLKAIHFQVAGKINEDKLGNFTFINPLSYDRSKLNLNEIFFKNFTLVFRNPAAGLY
ncbi:MAG: hypothetical protein AAF985_00065 [Bacteroidota bacterium]